MTYYSKICVSEGWSTLLLRNCIISRAGELHRSRIADFHAQEQSITQEMQISTRGNSPPLKNCRFPRAGTFHRSEIVKSHARDGSGVTLYE